MLTNQHWLSLSLGLKHGQVFAMVSEILYAVYVVLNIYMVANKLIGQHWQSIILTSKAQLIFARPMARNNVYISGVGKYN